MIEKFWPEVFLFLAEKHHGVQTAIILEILEIHQCLISSTQQANDMGLPFLASSYLTSALLMGAVIFLTLRVIAFEARSFKFRFRVALEILESFANWMEVLLVLMIEF